MFAVAVTLVGGWRLSAAAPVHAMDACTSLHWAIAQCGFNTDCDQVFEPYGCGTPDTCWYDPIEDMVHYEGMCYQSDEPCTVFFC